MKSFFDRVRFAIRLMYDSLRGTPRYCLAPVEWLPNRVLYRRSRLLGYRNTPSDAVRYLVSHGACECTIRLVSVPSGVFGYRLYVWQWQTLSTHLRSASKRATHLARPIRP